jgi:TonB family protein
VAAPASVPERTGVWIEMSAADVRDAMPVEAVDLPAPELPPLPEPLVAEEVPPEPVLEPLPAEEPEPLVPPVPALSLEVIGRRTKPLPPPVPAPPPAPVRAPRPTVVHRPVAAPSRPPSSPNAPLHVLFRPSFGVADYPAEARRLRIQGTALVRITIGTSGHVVDAVLLVSSGSPILDADAIPKARMYRFAPIPAPRAENLPVLYALD